jgi:hypothetical protein
MDDAACDDLRQKDIVDLTTANVWDHIQSTYRKVRATMRTSNIQNGLKIFSLNILELFVQTTVENTVVTTFRTCCIFKERSINSL